MKEIALWVDDATSAYQETTRRGARGVREPQSATDEFGEVRTSAIAAYGDTLHGFVERKNYRGVFLPGFRAVEGEDTIARPVGLKYIDHMVGNVGWGQMNAWVGFYRDIMGFQLYQHFDDQGHQHRVLGPDVESDVERQWAGQISDQRAGRRKKEIADRGVFGVLSRPRRPTYCDGDR